MAKEEKSAKEVGTKGGSHKGAGTGGGGATATGGGGDDKHLHQMSSHLTKSSASKIHTSSKPPVS